MSWNVFRKVVDARIKFGLDDKDDLAKIIAIEYERVVKSPVSGDLFFRNNLVRGNKDALENQIKLALDVGSVSGPGYKFMELASLGLQFYWTGAELSKLKVPLVPAPGSVGNVSISTNLVLNPGTVTPLPTPGVTKSSQFIETFIQVAKLHLFTLSGLTQTISTYPPGVTGPGFLPWIGYFALDIRGKIPDGFSETNDLTSDVIINDETGERFAFDQNGNLAKLMNEEFLIDGSFQIGSGEFELIEILPNGTKNYLFKIKTN